MLSPAWCSKLRLTTGIKILALIRDEFHRPRSDFVRQEITAFVNQSTLSIKCKYFVHSIVGARLVLKGPFPFRGDSISCVTLEKQ
ncbi:hypothetical protein TNCV_1044971 [Trichonephila clavipes]|nr:hypothetical protein TNCV_1044971 [Trichonephila clavipes]